MTRFLFSFLLVVGSLAAPAGELCLVSYNIRQDTAGDKGPRDWPERRDLVARYLRE